MNEAVRKLTVAMGERGTVARVIERHLSEGERARLPFEFRCLLADVLRSENELMRLLIATESERQ